MKAQQYLTSLGARLGNWLNSVDFKTQLGSQNVYHFHKRGENAKTIQVPTMANRSVKLKLGGVNAKPVEIVSKQGSLVVSKPAPEGVLISTALEVYDEEVSGVVTDLSLTQEMDTLVQTLDSVVTTEILKTVLESEHKANYITEEAPVAVADKRQKTLADGLEEALFIAKTNSNSLGQEYSDFTIGLSNTAYNVMSHAAHRNGFKTVSEMFDTEVFPYDHDSVLDNPNSVQGFLIPKRHTGVSLREGDNGVVFNTEVTRVPERQSAILEVTASAQLVIAGFTKLTVPTDGTAGERVEVAMPLVRKFSVAMPA